MNVDVLYGSKTLNNCLNGHWLHKFHRKFLIFKFLKCYAVNWIQLSSEHGTAITKLII